MAEDPEYVRLSKPDYEGWLVEDSEGTDDSTIPKDYDANDYVSGPIRVKDGTVPINILEFQYAYNSHSSLELFRQLHYTTTFSYRVPVILTRTTVEDTSISASPIQVQLSLHPEISFIF